MNAVGRVLIVLGAAGVAISAVLPWVTIKGITLTLDLGIIGASVSPGSRTVSGTDTSVWPFLVATAAVVALLGLLGFGRWLLAGIGLLAILAGGALLYYVANVIEIETRDAGVIKQKLAGLVLTSSAGPGPSLLIASGVAVLAGALLLRR